MFSDAEDLDRLTHATKIALTLFESDAFAGDYDGLLSPADWDRETIGLAELVRRHVVPAYHPAGTCSMGARAQAVLDPALKVRGVERLRVVDASAMPSPISGNIQAAIIMMAEKTADMIAR